MTTATRGRRSITRRRETAERLTEATDGRTAKQQLSRLDARLGKNQGAGRERARLHKQAKAIVDGQA